MSQQAVAVIPPEQFYGCVRKAPYRSRKQIKDAISRYERKPGSPKLDFYRCDVCGAFHLTKKKAVR